MTTTVVTAHLSTSPRYDRNPLVSAQFHRSVTTAPRLPSLCQLYRKFRPNETAPTKLGKDRDYNIDLIPKFIISSGELTKMLVHTEVTRYLEFKQIAGSFVYRDGKISKVPSTEMEAVKSPLMGLFEKRRAKKFFEFLQNWKDDDPATHQGTPTCHRLVKLTP